MFASELRDLEARLTMPYPERAAFISEVGDDLEQTYRRLLTAGSNAEDARRQALAELEFSNADLVELGVVHAPSAARAVARLPLSARSLVEDFGGVVPLIVFTLFMVEEDSMIEFLREGGVQSVVVILALGGLGLGLELQRAFRWFVLRDHSEPSLSGFSTGPLYLAGACFLSGVLSTAFGVRLSLAAAAISNAPDTAIRAGVSESLAGLIVATGITGAIVLLHGWLATWRERLGLRGKLAL